MGDLDEDVVQHLPRRPGVGLDEIAVLERREHSIEGDDVANEVVEEVLVHRIQVEQRRGGVEQVDEPALDIEVLWLAAGHLVGHEVGLARGAEHAIFGRPVKTAEDLIAVGGRRREPSVILAARVVSKAIHVISRARVRVTLAVRVRVDGPADRQVLGPVDLDLHPGPGQGAAGDPIDIDPAPVVRADRSAASCTGKADRATCLTHVRDRQVEPSGPSLRRSPPTTSRAPSLAPTPT